MYERIGKESLYWDLMVFGRIEELRGNSPLGKCTTVSLNPIYI